MTIVTVGIDLAKNVFAVQGVDETGKPVLARPEVARAKLLKLSANLPPCLIGMETCSGAHHWARLFTQFGHTMRLKAPKFVAPYRMGGRRGKNDAADAAANREAVTRPDMRLGGVGPATACAVVATVGKCHDFSCGRQFCAWLGLVPGQYSSGGKQRLGRITKAGARTCAPC